MEHSVGGLQSRADEPEEKMSNFEGQMEEVSRDTRQASEQLMSNANLRLQEDEFRRASFRVTGVPDAEMGTGQRTSPQT